MGAVIPVWPVIRVITEFMENCDFADHFSLDQNLLCFMSPIILNVYMMRAWLYSCWSRFTGKLVALLCNRMYTFCSASLTFCSASLTEYVCEVFICVNVYISQKERLWVHLCVCVCEHVHACKHERERERENCLFWLSCWLQLYLTKFSIHTKFQLCTCTKICKTWTLHLHFIWRISKINWTNNGKKVFCLYCMHD